jgi:hypothetical protein
VIDRKPRRSFDGMRFCDLVLSVTRYNRTLAPGSLTQGDFI